ncbi:MAG: hypothetical protein NTV34_17870 [Proteobacteria bacterium]|nr:hypothetical protein [Pseudomonadota bacterium]
MGIYWVHINKDTKAESAVSGFNSNVNLTQQQIFLQALEGQGADVIHLPSHLFYRDQILKNTSYDRWRLWSGNLDGKNKYLKGLEVFQQEIGSVNLKEF